jgi:Skp family chaperone for outer membrane proteins
MPAFSKSVLGAVLVLSLVSAVETQAQAKIGTVDMERVLKEYHKSKEVEAKLNEATKAAKKEFDDRVEAYKKALDDINKLNAQIDTPALSADAKAVKAKNATRKLRASRTWSARLTTSAKLANSSSSNRCFAFAKAL